MWSYLVGRFSNKQLDRKVLSVDAKVTFLNCVSLDPSDENPSPALSYKGRELCRLKFFLVLLVVLMLHTVGLRPCQVRPSIRLVPARYLARVARLGAVFFLPLPTRRYGFLVETIVPFDSKVSGISEPVGSFTGILRRDNDAGPDSVAVCTLGYLVREPRLSWRHQQPTSPPLNREVCVHIERCSSCF